MTSSTGIKTLSLETIDQIIGAVADIDYQDETQYEYEMRNVKACSLTCRTLARLCRRRIFHSIRVFDSSPSPAPHFYGGNVIHFPNTSRRGRPSAQSFAQLITDNPEIAGHVVALEYYVRAGRPYLVHVPTEFGALERLQKLSIHSDRSNDGYVQWPDLVYSTAWKGLYELMHRPTVKSVNLNCVQLFNIGDLVACSNLKSLTLRHCKISEGKASFPPDLPNNPMKLRELSILPHTKSLPSLLQRQYDDDETFILDKRELKKITLDISDNYGDEFLCIAQFLDLTSLDDLKLLRVSTASFHSNRNQGSNLFPRLLLTPLKTLKSLTLDLSIYSFAQDWSEPDVPRMINSISAQNCIEKLTLVVTLEASSPTPVDHWGLVKECILRLQWPSLTRVDLTMSTVRERRPTVDGKKTYIRLPNSQCMVEVP